MADENLQITTESKTIKKKKILKIIGIIFIVISLITLIIVKISNPDFSFGSILVLGFISVLVGFILFYSNNIIVFLKRNKEESSEIFSSSPKEMASIAKGIVEASATDGNPYGMENNIDEILIARWITGTDDKERFFHIKIKPLYIDDNKEEIDFIFNSKYPSVYWNRDFNLSHKQVTERANKMSKKPEKRDIEQIIRRSPLTGVEEKTIKQMVKRETKKEDKKEET